MYTMDHNDFLWLQTDAAAFSYLPLGSKLKNITWKMHSAIKPIAMYMFGTDDAVPIPINYKSILVCDVMRENYKVTSDKRGFYVLRIDYKNPSGGPSPFGSATYDGNSLVKININSKKLRNAQELIKAIG